MKASDISIKQIERPSIIEVFSQMFSATSQIKFSGASTSLFYEWLVGRNAAIA
jgi:hypothetical protein